MGCQRGALWSGLRKPAAERNTGTGGSALCGALSRRGAWTEQGDEQRV